MSLKNGIHPDWEVIFFMIVTFACVILLGYGLYATLRLTL